MHLLRQFITFFGVGVAATVADWGSFFILERFLGVPSVYAALTAYCCGGVLSYVLNRIHRNACNPVFSFMAVVGYYDMRVIRPVVAAIFAVAGAYAIARMVESSLFVALRSGIVPDGVNGPLSRFMALAAMVLVLGSLGWRAVLRSLQHADQACEQVAHQKLGPMMAGLPGSALSLPLAIAVMVDTPLLSFFR